MVMEEAMNGEKRKSEALEDQGTALEDGIKELNASLNKKQKKKQISSGKEGIVNGQSNKENLTDGNEVELSDGKAHDDSIGGAASQVSDPQNNDTQKSKKKKKKKKKQQESTPSEEKRKADALEDQGTASEDGVQQLNASPSKKQKKKLKKSAKEGIENGQSNEENHADGDQVELNKSDAHDDSQVSGAQKSKKKNRKKKKKQATPSVVASTVISDVSEGEPFSNLKDSVSEETLKAIRSMGFTNMTSIQSKAIPPLLEGKDVRGTAKTGSGKTLAFLIPMVECLHRQNFKPTDGTGAIIISPTRELSLQTLNVLRKLVQNHKLSTGLIMGGTKQEEEAEHIRNGINIIVATPGRLLSHLERRPEMITKKLACLVIDEADRILDVGFEKEMNRIIEILPENKQTMFFCATRNRKVNLLARLSLKDEPLEVDSNPVTGVATVEGLEQAYVICQTDKKFLLLHNFLEKNKKKKILVFFITCKAVQFYHHLLSALGFQVTQIHGKKTQEQRTSAFYDFCKSPSGVLLSTDVAARGWDVPSIDWIVQFDIPEDSVEYIHRVGRTARAGGKGKALIFLREEEKGFLTELKNRNIPVTMENISWDKTSDVQLKVEKNVNNNKDRKALAIKAFESIMLAYLKNPKGTWDIKTLDMQKLSRCFGFQTPPVLPQKLQSQLNEIVPKKKIKPKRFRKANNPNRFSGRKGGPENSKDKKFKGKEPFKGKPTFKGNKVEKAKYKRESKKASA